MDADAQVLVPRLRAGGGAKSEPWRRDGPEQHSADIGYGGQVSELAYDRNGNQVSESSNGALTTYLWDEENRLTRAQYPDGVEDLCVYFQDGRRYRLTHNWTDAVGPHSWTHLLVWHGQNLLLEQNETLSARLHFLGRPEAAGQVLGEYQVGGGTEPTRLFFYGHDLSGNTRQVIGMGGAFVHGYLYNAFGEVLAQSGGATSVGVGGQVTSNGFQNERNPIRFGGEVGYYTDNSDRLYVRARNYKPSVGRWMSTDPIEFEGGNWNLYGYVWNSVPNWTDASGLGEAAPTPAERWDFREEALRSARAKRPEDRNATEARMIQRDDALANSGVDKYDQRMRANGGPPTRTWPSRSRSTPDDIPPDTSFRYQFGKNVDDYLLMGSAEELGRTFGGYESGRASGWELTGAVVKTGANVTLLIFDGVALAKGAQRFGTIARENAAIARRRVTIPAKRTAGAVLRRTTRRRVVNLGGEGEMLGVINQQGPWADPRLNRRYPRNPIQPEWRGRGNKTMAQLREEGHLFVISTNTKLPFASNSVRRVNTNAVPVDMSTHLGPGIQSSEIMRILQPGGKWIHDGKLRAVKK